MNYWEAVQEGKNRLHEAGLETPFLDSTLLLAEAGGISKEKLFASLREKIPEDVEKGYVKLIEKRLSGLPVSYILGRKEFYGLQFYVDRRVLVPRPETEILIDHVLEILSFYPRSKEIHDTCTGSGCIPITLAYRFPGLSITASDISEDALEVCERNSRQLLGEPLPVFKSDLLESVPGRFDIITANPPYLTENEIEEMKEANWPEPFLALCGGRDGLDLIRRLVPAALDSLRESGYLIIEAASPQCTEIEELFRASGYGDVRTIKDLGGRKRVVSGRKG